MSRLTFLFLNFMFSYLNFIIYYRYDMRNFFSGSRSLFGINSVPESGLLTQTETILNDKI
jgi:hypothetical protein